MGQDLDALVLEENGGILVVCRGFLKVGTGTSAEGRWNRQVPHPKDVVRAGNQRQPEGLPRRRRGGAKRPVGAARGREIGADRRWELLV